MRAIPEVSLHRLLFQEQNLFGRNTLYLHDGHLIFPHSRHGDWGICQSVGQVF